MAKGKICITLTNDAMKLLSEMCKTEHRSKSNLVEHCIMEYSKNNSRIPVPEVPIIKKIPKLM
jgi:hypothetical protein